MTDEQDPRRRDGPLRDEAADWFAAMRGPDAETQRTAFEVWLAHSALNRTAYNRIGETFSLGKGLKRPVGGQEASHQTAFLPTSRAMRRRTIIGICAAFVVGATALIVYALWTGDEVGTMTIRNPGAVSSPASPAPRPVQLATRVGEIRNFPLSDGSAVTLDSDSLLFVSFAATGRNLRLVRGRGRFAVAHEARPFVVAVAGSTVTARGTMFDVELDRADKVIVHLIRGRVDVALPHDRKRAAESGEIERMTAGDSLSFGPTVETARAQSAAENLHWPQGLEDFDRARLADFVVEANRYAAKPIILASADLADLRLSGAYRIRETMKLAENVGDMLGLAVTDRPDAIVLARSCPKSSKENCRPPS